MYRENYFSSRSVGRSGLARRLRNRLPVIIDQPKGLSRKKRHSEKFRAIFPQKTKKRRNGCVLTVSAFVCAPNRRENARRRRLFGGFFVVIRPTFRRLFGGCSADFSPVVRSTFRRYSPVIPPTFRRFPTLARRRPVRDKPLRRRYRRA